LAIRLPRNRSAGSYDDRAAHTPKFEEWELNAFTDCIAKLGSPAGIAISGKTMMLSRRWRDGVGVCFRVR
jgi:hypothetical protein